MTGKDLGGGDLLSGTQFLRTWVTSEKYSANNRQSSSAWRDGGSVQSFLPTC